MKKMNEYVALDIEKTGLWWNDGDRLIALGMVKVKDGQITDRFEQFYHPDGRAIRPTELATHGISAEMLADKPKFADDINRIRAFVGDLPLMAHNAIVDMGHIHSEFKRAGEPLLSNEVLDTKPLATALYPKLHNTLDALCSGFQVSTERPLHGALLDATLLHEVFESMQNGKTRVVTADREMTYVKPGQIKRDVTGTGPDRDNFTPSEIQQQKLETLLSRLPSEQQQVVQKMQQKMYQDGSYSDPIILKASETLVAMLEKQRESPEKNASIPQAIGHERT